MVGLTLLSALAASMLYAGATPVNRADAVPYYNPTDQLGGSMLDWLVNGKGEPLNVIVSALSSPDVLTVDGIVNYARSIGYSAECLGLHLGDPQTATLGDGNHNQTELIVIREDFGNEPVGTCLESLIGGNHFRVFKQNGTEAQSNALFLAVSQEEDVTQGHTISPNGYNIGRDKLVAAAIGDSSFGGVSYSTRRRTSLDFLNQARSRSTTDGIVTLLTVTIL
ncbi:hypothetical protein PENSPDRAFT_688582 [Peniophora sp. CONT]|nr:hypothetical protein PENSPDRAFT_688582 [Peniophora sp. CONT]